MVCGYIVRQMKTQKVITARELKRGAPEDKLAPGESLLIEKGGKVFEMRRVDERPKDMNAQMRRLLEETPIDGPMIPTDFAKILAKDRE